MFITVEFSAYSNSAISFIIYDYIQFIVSWLEFYQWICGHAAILVHLPKQALYGDSRQSYNWPLLTLPSALLTLFFKNLRNAWIISSTFQFAFVYHTQTHIHTHNQYCIFTLYLFITESPQRQMDSWRKCEVFNPKINEIITLSSE